ncbi:MAG: hypothetical protein KJP16_07860 [Gammaproteobacteria bacterium]|nr:hypothetical protein [Gammaproteobacteria bacterium]NNL50719.1 hypothetical protein [Woeseiaceae bacterium]
MDFNFSSRPNRRFLYRLGSSATVLGLSVVAARHLIDQEVIGGPLVWAIALVPGLAMFGIFYAYGMLILEQTDEFIRMLIIRQFVIATGIALSFATIWGFLEEFGLVEHVYSYYVAVAWVVGFAFGGLVNRLTHGAWGEMS